ECKDGTVKLWVNGTKVNEGREAIPRKGYICLESEGGVVLYRNVRVKELPDTPIAPEYVAAKSELQYSLYNGVDLSGWKSSSGWVVNDWILSNEGGSIATLESESGSGPNRFLFDFSFHPGAEVLEFYPKGKSGPSISVSPGDDGVKKSEEWNRIEGTVEGNTVSYTINGLEQKRTFEHVPEEGSIAFSAKGRIDLANIYLGPDLSVEF
ncbi:MAG: family 16 glycoside hydrolase, partial [Verrucomicrobiota bacterium]